MAADWIKMRSNLATDPDVVALAAAVGSDEFTVVGRLHALWAWADQHSEDGTLPRATSAFVDRLTACPGFAEALRGVGWLEGREAALKLPHWDRHNGSTAKARAVEARKKQAQRIKPTSGTNVPMNVPERAGPEERREENTDSLPTAREAVELPAHLPQTAEAAEKSLPTSAIPAAFLRDVWQQLASRGGRDGANVAVTNWSLYASRRWEREKSGAAEAQNHANQRPHAKSSSRNNSQALRAAASDYGEA